jgi:hypothetical protein
MKWIEVEDETPLPMLRVLVHCRYAEDHDWIITDAYYHPGKGWFFWGYHQSIFEVLHWHHLKEAPKEPVEEKKKTSHEEPSTGYWSTPRLIYRPPKT